MKKYLILGLIIVTVFLIIGCCIGYKSESNNISSNKEFSKDLIGKWIYKSSTFEFKHETDIKPLQVNYFEINQNSINSQSDFGDFKVYNNNDRVLFVFPPSFFDKIDYDAIIANQPDKYKVFKVGTFKLEENGKELIQLETTDEDINFIKNFPLTSSCELIKLEYHSIIYEKKE